MNPLSTISVIIPALNEAENLRDTVNAVYQAMGQRFGTYEILIFDDGSTDGTGRIADELAKEDKNVKVIHNPKTMGYGYNIYTGIKQARYEYVTMVPGDNEVPVESIEKMLQATGDTDIVILYFTNPEIRPIHRRIISRIYTTTLNLIFGLNLRYYNGPCVYRRIAVQNLPVSTDGFAYLSSNLIRMLKMGHSFVEVPAKLGERRHGSSKAITFSNTLVVVRTILILASEVFIRKRKKFTVSQRN